MPASARVVLVAVPRGGKAAVLAEAMVRARLAACVNVVPKIASVYRWRGRVRRDDEALLLVKTTAPKLKALERWIKARHPYQTPEFLVLAAAGGSKEYLSWLTEQAR